MITLPQEVTRDMVQLEPLLIDLLTPCENHTAQLIKHVFQSGGKRIRPALFLISSYMWEYGGPDRMVMAAICEYIHTASLLHDDVIDDADQRRHQSTVNHHWSNSHAILLGDFVYSSACELMVQSKNFEVIHTFAHCIRAMSESEIIQAQHLWNWEITLSEYLKIIFGKTCCLFSACLSVPLCLKGGLEKQQAIMSQFGEVLGYIFQITDDYLDYVGNKNKLGKQTLEDITKGKVTLPILLALNSSSSSQKKLQQELQKAFISKDCSEFKETILSLINETEGIHLTRKYIETLMNKGYGILDDLKKNYSISNEYIHLLHSMIEFAAERNN